MPGASVFDRRQRFPRPRIIIPIFSTLLFLTAGGVSALTILALAQNDHNIKGAACRAIMGLFGGLMGVVCLFQLFGFGCAVMRREKATSVYSSVMYMLWLATLIFGVINTVLISRERKHLEKECHFMKDLKGNDCKEVYTIFFAVTTTLWIVATLIAMLLVSASREYARHLVDKRLEGGPYVREEPQRRYGQPALSDVKEHSVRSDEAQG